MTRKVTASGAGPCKAAALSSRRLTADTGHKGHMDGGLLAPVLQELGQPFGAILALADPVGEVDDVGNQSICHVVQFSVFGVR